MENNIIKPNFKEADLFKWSDSINNQGKELGITSLVILDKEYARIIVSWPSRRWDTAYYLNHINNKGYDIPNFDIVLEDWAKDFVNKEN